MSYGERSCTSYIVAGSIGMFVMNSLQSLVYLLSVYVCVRVYGIWIRRSILGSMGPRQKSWSN